MKLTVSNSMSSFFLYSVSFILKSLLLSFGNVFVNYFPSTFHNHMPKVYAPVLIKLKDYFFNHLSHLQFVRTARSNKTRVYFLTKLCSENTKSHFQIPLHCARFNVTNTQNAGLWYSVRSGMTPTGTAFF